MMQDPWVLFALLIGPAILFMALFRRSWADGDLQRAALAGGCAGVLATVPVKFFVYPALGAWLGIDLRQFVTGQEPGWITAGACFGLIAPIEEISKWLAAMTGVLLLHLERRGPAIFLAFAACGLGFSLAENLDYLSFYGPDVLWIRGTVSSGGHILFSGLAGLGVALFLTPEGLSNSAGFLNGCGRMLFLLLAAIALHGAFNLAAFTFDAARILPLLVFALLAGLIGLREGWIHLLRGDAGEGPVPWACPGCGLEKCGGERFCPTCGTRVAARLPQSGSSSDNAGQR